MNKKSLLLAALLLVGSHGFAQKLSPSTNLLLQEMSAGKRKAKAADGQDNTVSCYVGMLVNQSKIT